MSPPATSILYEPGNCILLAIYRLVGDVGLYNTYCGIARSRPIEGGNARPYKDCVDYTQCCDLVPVEVGDLEIGGRYLINADGRSEGPRCLIMQIDKDGASRVSTSSVSYVRHMPAIREILLKSADKPIVCEYGSRKKQSSVGSQQSTKAEAVSLLNSKA